MDSSHCTAKDGNNQLDFHKHHFNENIEPKMKFHFETDLEKYGSISMACSNYISNFCPLKYLYTNGRSPTFKDCQGA